MGDHYFSNNPSVESSPKTIRFQLKGHDMTFTSDRGVFSKNEVDFGTRQLIESFTEPEIEGPLLDVGCGYGPIGITLAKVYNDRNVTMVDVNSRAIELAKRNSELNQVANATVHESNLLSGVQGKHFASIITNPPIRAGKQTVHKLFEEAYDHLLPNGELWVVIQKKQGAPSAIEKLETMFTTVEVVNKKKGYYIIRSKRD